MSALSPVLARLHELGRDLVSTIPNLALALLVLAVAYLVGRLVKSAVRRGARRLGRHLNAALILGGLSHWLVMILGVLSALVVVFPSFHAASLVQVLGLASVAIGFAFRDVLQNFLAGIILLWTQPFRLGDQIVFGEFEGTVEDIRTRATVVATYDGRRVVIPNAELFTSPVTVNTAQEIRRIEYDIAIGMESDVARAKRLIHTALASVDGVLSSPQPDVLVHEVGDFALKLRVRWWIRPPTRASVLDARDAVLEQLVRALTEAGVELPYPTMDIRLSDPGDAAAAVLSPGR